MSKCVVLHSSSSYSTTHLPLLRSILDMKPELLAVTGVDCQAWEDAMDWLCIDLATGKELPDVFCNTTSHPDEDLAEVIAFAKCWSAPNGDKPDVQVIEV